MLESLAGGRINSLYKLTREVLDRIGDGGTRYALSPRRIKKVASRDRIVRIRVITRRAAKAMESCPICGGELAVADARDVYGKKTRWGKYCSLCGFKVDPGKREPARYIFDLRW